MNELKIAPSILFADFSRLQDEMQAVEKRASGNYIVSGSGLFKTPIKQFIKMRKLAVSFRRLLFSRFRVLV